MPVWGLKLFWVFESGGSGSGFEIQSLQGSRFVTSVLLTLGTLYLSLGLNYARQSSQNWPECLKCMSFITAKGPEL